MQCRIVYYLRCLYLDSYFLENVPRKNKDRGSRGLLFGQHSRGWDLTFLRLSYPISRFIVSSLGAPDDRHALGQSDMEKTKGYPKVTSSISSSVSKGSLVAWSCGPAQKTKTPGSTKSRLIDLRCFSLSIHRQQVADVPRSSQASRLRDVSTLLYLVPQTRYVQCDTVMVVGNVGCVRQSAGVDGIYRLLSS